jgi:glycosyltransferase involved in cell wall biosynthesis
MACGAAVVATETEGAREIIKPGETGVLVPIGAIEKLAQAISKLLQDEAERVRLGTAAELAASAQFNVARMITETEEIYRAEVQENRREAGEGF